MPRKRRLDYALRKPQWGMWFATAAILIVGVVAIYYVTSGEERGRMELLERLEVGDSVGRVVALLGQPARRCAAGSLEHLEAHFPPGWLPGTRELALRRLQEATARRWIYPLDLERQVGCGAEQGVTEIGLTAEQQVLWYVPITGSHPMELPRGFTPEALEPTEEENDG